VRSERDFSVFLAEMRGEFLPFLPLIVITRDKAHWCWATSLVAIISCQPTPKPIRRGDTAALEPALFGAVRQWSKH
jgi:hypothetical protein